MEKVELPEGLWNVLAQLVINLPVGVFGNMSGPQYDKLRQDIVMAKVEPVVEQQEVE